MFWWASKTTWNLQFDYTGCFLQSSSDAQSIRNDGLWNEAESDSEPEIDTENTNQMPEHNGYKQDSSKNNSSAILADVFHEMFKVTRTISTRNTLLKRFAQAFTDTMLIPDQGDKAAVEVVLARRIWNGTLSKQSHQIGYGNEFADTSHIKMFYIISWLNFWLLGYGKMLYNRGCFVWCRNMAKG